MAEDSRCSHLISKPFGLCFTIRLEGSTSTGLISPGMRSDRELEGQWPWPEIYVPFMYLPDIENGKPRQTFFKTVDG